MYIRKARAGSAPGHTWDRDGAVLEVDDHLAEQLLHIPHGGFSIAEAPEEHLSVYTPVEEIHEPDNDKEAEVEEEPEEDSKRSPGRPRLPRDSKGRIVRN